MASSDHGILFYTLFFSALVIFTILFKSSTKSATKTRTPPSPMALPIIGHLHLMGSTTHKSFQTLARLYGPLMQLRLGASTCVVVSNAQVAREILKTHDLNFSHRPTIGYSEFFQYNGSNFISAPYGPYWRFMKKLCMTELLLSSQIGRFTHIREQERRKLVEFLMTCSGEGRACDLSTQFTAFISTMICRMAISTTSLCEVNDANGIYGLVKEFVELAAKLSLGEVLGPLRKLDLFGYGKRIQEVVAWFDQVVEGIMKEHEENFEGRTKDMMDILLQVYRDPNAEIKLTRKNIKSFFLDFFLAGTDTSAVTLQWTMAEIINHPQVLNKLRAEMDSVLGSTRLVNESDVPNLPYLQAVVKEVLRLHPAIPVNVREPAEDCIVNGYDLKAHTRVMFNFYAIMRDPEVWPNPDKFIPERFLVNRSEINGRDQLVMDKKGQDFTYIPFGRGRRGCPGESLALTVIHATVGALIQCFDWKIDGGYKVNMEEGSGFSLVLAKPLVVHPITRFNPF